MHNLGGLPSYGTHWIPICSCRTMPKWEQWRPPGAEALTAQEVTDLQAAAKDLRGSALQSHCDSYVAAGQLPEAQLSVDAAFTSAYCAARGPPVKQQEGKKRAKMPDAWGEAWRDMVERYDLTYDAVSARARSR